MKKHESHVGELDQLKLNTAVFNGDEDVHMTQQVGFIAAKSVSVG